MQQEIVDAFNVLRAAIRKDCPAEAQPLALAGVAIGEAVVRDLRRIADAQESMAQAYVYAAQTTAGR